MRFPWSKKAESLLRTIDPIRVAIENAREAKNQELFDVKQAKETEWDKWVDPILKTVPELILASDGKNFFIKGLPQAEFYSISSYQVYIRDETCVEYLVRKLKWLGMESQGSYIDNQFVLKVFI